MIPRHLYIGVAVTAVAALVMGIFAWRVRGRAAQVDSAATYTRPVAPPSTGSTEQVTLYVAYDDPGVLLPQLSVIPLPGGRQQRAEELLRALMDVYISKSSPHPLGTGADVRNVYLVDPGVAVIDLNAAFAEGHRSGILVEELTIVSLVETLTANIPGVTRVKILVDGKERETLAGHADLSRFYDVTSVGDLLNQMRSVQ
jgi:hypothetical protein